MRKLLLPLTMFTSRFPFVFDVLISRFIFINRKRIIGQSHIEGFYVDVVRTHGFAKGLSRACLAKMSPVGDEREIGKDVSGNNSGNGWVCVVLAAKENTMVGAGGDSWWFPVAMGGRG
ncbi:unnamed protein product [Lactuca saligna]|uniref:Uncharacterized protein n=1 Tax=Lactuca saligna TaxID=75948 RepID=A0AA35Z5I9_LACSI|nr:unnamed protein product [Lactuca saligna]